MGCEYRCGQGLDIHELVAAENTKYIKLCGVKIPYHKELKGHSDADAPLHALVDAILGALGKGDIGEHFPPNDPKWKNCNSAVFVKHACSLVAECLSEIANVDITIVLQEPNISAYKNSMKDNIAALLNITTNRVNIKATTAENLGFLGRNEGILSLALVTLKIFDDPK